MGSTGTSTIDFGAFPGMMDAQTVITGQTGILAGSLVEAWISPVATADHTADEHWVEPIQMRAGNIVAGTGFTIYAQAIGQTVEMNPAINCDANRGLLSTGHCLYGLYSLNWAWN